MDVAVTEAAKCRSKKRGDGAEYQRAIKEDHCFVAQRHFENQLLVEERKRLISSKILSSSHSVARRRIAICFALL